MSPELYYKGPVLVRMQVLGHIPAVSTLLGAVGLPASEPCALGIPLVITDCGILRAATINQFSVKVLFPTLVFFP